MVLASFFSLGAKSTFGPISVRKSPRPTRDPSKKFRNSLRSHRIDSKRRQKILESYIKNMHRASNGKCYFLSKICFIKCHLTGKSNGTCTELKPLLFLTRKVPGPQTIAFPMATLYLPASHCAHGPLSCPADPVVQLQLVTTLLPAGEVDWARHSKHAKVLMAQTNDEYLRESQLEHINAALAAVPFQHVTVSHAV